jgi:hypothetical protein
LKRGKGNLTAAVKRGVLKGLTVTVELAKIVVPVYILVTFFKYTPVLGYIARGAQPVMKMVGLPGEASVAIVLGYFTNLYAAIGAIASLKLSPKEITIIATMLLIAHSLPMETAVTKKTGVSGTAMVTIRVVLSLAAGALLNVIL